MNKLKLIDSVAGGGLTEETMSKRAGFVVWLIAIVVHGNCFGVSRRVFVDCLTVIDSE